MTQVTSDKRHHAIMAARDVFWRNGYEEASMTELVEATGLNRYAIYSIFGSKRDLFLATLESYFAHGEALFYPIINDTSRPALERIEHGLYTMIELTLHQGQGCYICHVAVKESDRDQTVCAAVNEFFDRILEAMSMPMRDAMEAGHLNPNLTPEMAARIVFAAEMSMGLYIQAAAPRETLQSIAHAAMAAISAPGAWSPIDPPKIVLPEEMIASFPKAPVPN
ncbi:MAG: TetR/AcrR family transcriptional regulator [Alphaproteobacteria bacterium]|nr:TetR/AcrR family transcriptional regulator [Alphaproteobacteria bacterium SS10]